MQRHAAVIEDAGIAGGRGGPPRSISQRARSDDNHSGAIGLKGRDRGRGCCRRTDQVSAAASIANRRMIEAIQTVDQRIVGVDRTLPIDCFCTLGSQGFEGSCAGRGSDRAQSRGPAPAPIAKKSRRHHGGTKRRRDRNPRSLSPSNVIRYSTQLYGVPFRQQKRPPREIPAGDKSRPLPRNCGGGQRFVHARTIR